MAPRKALPLLFWAGVALGAHPRPPAPTRPLRPRPPLQPDTAAGRGRGGALPDVVNGEKVEGFPYPWLAWQGDDDIGHFCGGTLIAPDWVLTAAHCLCKCSSRGCSLSVFESQRSWCTDDTLPPEHSVRIEVHRRDYSVPIGQEDGAARRVIAAHPHPNYVK